MRETHDTIDGLLAEFRGYSAGMPPSYHVTMSWADFRKMLDRFDAANKRERGDCAKLREALIDVVKRLEAYTGCDHHTFHPTATTCDGITSVGKCGKIGTCAAIFKARAALSAPPRNCDRPECATTKAAADVWRKEDGGKTVYHDWLLALSTEKEGGAK